MKTIPVTLQDAIRARSLIERAVEHAEADLKDLEKTLADAEKIVVDTFIESKTEAITVDGVKYSINTAPVLSPATDCGPQVVQWINENGGADLTKPNMHWASRNAFLNEKLIDDDGKVNIPDDLLGLVQVFTDPRLAKRKA